MNRDHHTLLDDDLPPPLEDTGKLIEPATSVRVASAASEEHENSNQQISGGEDPQSTPLMDVMVAEARKAEEKKKQEQMAKREKESKVFGSGLKKGFFHTSAPKKKPTSKAPKEQIPTIVKREEQSSFVFPEVAEALRKDNSLQQLSQSQEWITPELMAKFAKHPLLVRALQDPHFLDAVQELQNDPAKAMKKYKGNPHFESALTEFMKTMGEHFEELSKKKQEEEHIKKPPTEEDVIKEALHQMPRKPEEEDQVQKILADRELQMLLSDAELRETLQRCQDPVEFGKAMQNSEFRRKVDKLRQAGLVNIQM